MNTDKKITIYSTNWCVYCKQAKKYLDKKGVAYTEKNIEEDAAANAELMKKLGGAFTGVPIIEIGDQLIDGFNRAAIDAALAVV
ncbi:NrdH-redoxin [Alphaproteobacteria bacterium]|nr:NrdH-redoxin [Alphaproteobacteria bacterium]